MFKDNKCLAVVGWRIQHKTVASMLYVDDLVVTDEARGQGTGRQIIDEIKRIANEANCQAVLLDTARPDAKKFYKAIGMDEVATVFAQVLD
jgi:predicted GNAT superfamily acetyltransferase